MLRTRALSVLSIWLANLRKAIKSRVIWALSVAYESLLVTYENPVPTGLSTNNRLACLHDKQVACHLKQAGTRHLEFGRTRNQTACAGDDCMCV